MRSKKGRSSEMYEKGRWRGCEAAGVIHLDRVTAWPQAHWGGQRQHRDTGQAVGTLSLFVTLAWPSIRENTPLPSLLSSTLALVFFPFPTRLPPPARLSFLLWPPSLGLLVLSLSFFSYSPSWLHTFWSLEQFHSFHLQSLPSSYDFSISFCSPLNSWIWFSNLHLHILALFGPIPFPLQNHPWYLFDCHQPVGRWKSILPPATASLWLGRKRRQLAGL